MIAWSLLPQPLQAELTLHQKLLSEIDILHLTLDSRSVKPGSLFFAIPGAAVDGRAYIADALANRAELVLYDVNDFDEADRLANQVPQDKICLGVQGLSQWIGIIASVFYNHPSAALRLVGVTGTNGKTTLTHLIAQSFQLLGIKSAVMGTNGYGAIDQLIPQSLTTPNAIQLQAQLASLRDEGFELVAMEVSSHALVQHRVSGCAFSIAVITNITQDHLDYHGTMAEYAKAKHQLFALKGLSCAVVHFSCLQAMVEYQSPIAAQDLVVYGGAFDHESMNPLDAAAALGFAGTYGQITGHFLTAEPLNQIELLLETIKAGQRIDAQKLASKTALLGVYNLDNLMALAAVLSAFGEPIENIQSTIVELKSPQGRMELIHVPGVTGPKVIVDFAHTPDALSAVLNALALVKPAQSRLILVFGCGGDRDQGKRPLMAKIPGALSDYVIVTSDNPRYELQAEISAHILAGFTETDHYELEENRLLAIEKAIHLARKSDIVLIAGKGHEAYQEIAGVRMAFSDQQLAKACLMDSKLSPQSCQ